MCSKSITLNYKSCTCNCANACRRQHFEARKVIRPQRNETMVAALTKPFNSVIKTPI